MSSWTPDGWIIRIIHRAENRDGALNRRSQVRILRGSPAHSCVSVVRTRVEQARRFAGPRMSGLRGSVPGANAEYEGWVAGGFSSLTREGGRVAVSAVVGKADVWREFAAEFVTEADTCIDFR